MTVHCNVSATFKKPITLQFCLMQLRPPQLIPIEQGLSLRVSTLKDAQAHLDILNENREHLKPYMPWAHFITEVEQYENFIKGLQVSRRKCEEFGYQIQLNNRMIGRITLLRFDLKNRKCEIGYWIAKNHEGKGIITQATQALVKIAFEQLDFERIEIRCAINNERSAAVPKRLGFLFEGILRHAEKSEKGYRDLQLWTLTRT